jgi:predicted transcriptional regulator
MATRLLPSHPKRNLILAVVEEQPGISLRALGRATGFKQGTLQYHLLALLRMGRIWTTRHGQRLRHFTGQQPSPAEVRELLVEHALDEVDRRIVAWLREAGPKRQVEALDALAGTGVPRSSLQLRLNRLVKQGFLRRREWARAVTYEAAGASPELPHARAQWASLFADAKKGPRVTQADVRREVQAVRRRRRKTQK